MFPFFSKPHPDNEFPARPGEYIHKKDALDMSNPIFKYAQPSDAPKVEAPKPELKKTVDPRPRGKTL